MNAELNIESTLRIAQPIGRKPAEKAPLLTNEQRSRRQLDGPKPHLHGSQACDLGGCLGTGSESRSPPGARPRARPNGVPEALGAAAAHAQEPEAKIAFRPLSPRSASAASRQPDRSSANLSTRAAGPWR